ncbi:LysR substrate-binding domain-containing protein [Streptomyces sp. A5-4]|uniref:LysR substrate-binding domain-containing protein n=1 Tax=Streptomyces sp. A5-4 TaxID=3384771 RepID=UPI003DA839F7
MYDVQLTEFPVAEPDFVTGPVLMSESRMLVVPSNHPLARREFLSYEDLTRITLLAPLGKVPSYGLDAHFSDHTPSGAPIRRERAFTHWQEALALVVSGRGAVISAAQGAQYFGGVRQGREGSVARPAPVSAVREPEGCGGASSRESSAG